MSGEIHGRKRGVGARKLELPHRLRILASGKGKNIPSLGKERNLFKKQTMFFSVTSWGGKKKKTWAEKGLELPASQLTSTGGDDLKG